MFSIHNVYLNLHHMIPIFASCFSFILFGAFMASGTISWPLRPGIISAVFIVIMAWLLNRYWQRRRLVAGDDPSASERKIWLYMASTAMISGFVLATLMTPGAEIHRSTGDTGGFDTWVMLGGGFIAWLILHESNAQRDERDLAFDSYANKVGYNALIVLLLLFLLALGFAPRGTMQRFTHWLIANWLLMIIMWATLAQYVAQLICYRRDAQQVAALTTNSDVQTGSERAQKHD
jgi:hypothetical protein